MIQNGFPCSKSQPKSPGKDFGELSWDPLGLGICSAEGWDLSVNHWRLATPRNVTEKMMVGRRSVFLLGVRRIFRGEVWNFRAVASYFHDVIPSWMSLSRCSRWLGSQCRTSGCQEPGSAESWTLNEMPTFQESRILGVQGNCMLIHLICRKHLPPRTPSHCNFDCWRSFLLFLCEGPWTRSQAHRMVWNESWQHLR